MKTIYLFVAAVTAAGLCSCYVPPAAEVGPTPLRTSGAYSSSAYGHGSTYHSRPYRDPTGDWRHDDADDDDDDARYARGPAYPAYGPGPAVGVSSGAVVALPPGARRVSYGGRVYYTDRNMWYQPAAGGYVVVRSPY